MFLIQYSLKFVDIQKTICNDYYIITVREKNIHFKDITKLHN